MIEHTTDGRSIWRDDRSSQVEVLFEARDKIAELEDIKLQQAARLVGLAVENCALKENAQGVIAERYRMSIDALHAIEHFTFTCRSRGTCVFAPIAERLMIEAIEYSEGRPLGSLLAWAMRDAAHAAAKDGAL